MASLFNGLTDAVKLPMLPDEQRMYAEALLDKEAATAWLSSNCRFFRRGEKLYLTETDGRLREIEKGRLGGMAWSAGSHAVMWRHQLFEPALSGARGLPEPISLVKRYDVDGCWRGHLNGEGVNVRWEADTHFFKKVEIEGEGQLVWLETFSKKIEVFRIR